MVNYFHSCLRLWNIANIFMVINCRCIFIGSCIVQKFLNMKILLAKIYWAKKFVDLRHSLIPMKKLFGIVKSMKIDRRGAVCSWLLSMHNSDSFQVTAFVSETLLTFRLKFFLSLVYVYVSIKSKKEWKLLACIGHTFSVQVRFTRSITLYRNSSS